MIVTFGVIFETLGMLKYLGFILIGVTLSCHCSSARSVSFFVVGGQYYLKYDVF